MQDKSCASTGWVINLETGEEMSFRSFFVVFLFPWNFPTHEQNQSRRAKKPVMDEMFYTYVMENSTLLSQKAASEKLNVARKSQVPDPSGPVTSLLHMLGLLSPLFQTCHMERSYSANPNLPEHFAGPRAREDSPHLTLLSSHRSISKLNISHFNFLPAPLFWLIDHISFKQLFFSWHLN